MADNTWIMPAPIRTTAMTRSTTNPRLIALIVASSFFMQALDSAIISTSLPQMAQSFHVHPLDLSIGITIYLLSVAAFVPLSGWVADRFGARNVFSLAIVIFTLASLACGMSESLLQFALARAVQGLGGALMVPVGRIVVLRNTEKSELLQVTALITWPAMIAPVVGPALGGFITTYASWRWNFLLNIPLGMAGLALVYKFIPNYREAERTRLDLKGFLLSSTALISLLYGLETFAHTKVDWLYPVALIVAGSLVGTWAVRHFWRTANPLLNLSPFKVHTFSIATLGAGMFSRIGISATPFLLPLMFQVGFGLSAWASGMLILAYFGGNLGMKTITTPTLRRFGFRSVLSVNAMASGISILACAFLSADTPTFAIVLVLLAAGLTRSMQFTSLNTLAFADISVAQRSSSSTLSSMLQQISMVLGVALAAFILNAAEMVQGSKTMDMTDFRAAFAGVGLLSLLSSWMFLKLSRDAGCEVSGHRASH